MSFLSAGSLSKCLPGASGAIALETSPTAQVFIRVALDSPGLEASAGRQCGSVVPCRSRYCSLGTPALIFKSALVSKGIKTLDSTSSVFDYLKLQSAHPPKSLISVRSLTACIRFDEFTVRISKILVKENPSLEQMQNDS